MFHKTWILRAGGEFGWPGRGRSARRQWRLALPLLSISRASACQSPCRPSMRSWLMLGVLEAVAAAFAGRAAFAALLPAWEKAFPRLAVSSPPKRSPWKYSATLLVADCDKVREIRSLVVLLSGVADAPPLPDSFQSCSGQPEVWIPKNGRRGRCFDIQVDQLG